MDTTPITRLVEELRAVSGPAERARAATELLRVLADVQQQIKNIRQDDVRRLRKTLKLREVAELLDMSTARVDQIAKGAKRTG
jgi:hypothetical protein